MTILKYVFSKPVQSLLLIFSIALGTALVTAVSSYLHHSIRQAAIERELVFNRTIILSAGKDEGEEFFRDSTIPVTEVDVVAEPFYFNAQDLQDAKSAVPSASYIYMDSVLEVFFDEIGQLTVQAMDYEQFSSLNISVSQGQAFTEGDFDLPNPVMLITAIAAQNRGLLGDPVGGTVVWKDEPFTVIGILPDDYYKIYRIEAIIPRKVLSSDTASSLSFVVQDSKQLPALQNELELFAQKKWEGRASISYTGLEKAQSNRSLTRFFLAIFSTLGLLAAAMNLMNLLLADTIRRKRDFAILRSLGAQRKDIRSRLMSEAFLLSLVGGFLGVFLGYLFLFFFNNYTEKATGQPWTSNTPSPLVMSIGLAMAILMTLLFSFYPALRASQARISEGLGEG